MHMYVLIVCFIENKLSLICESRLDRSFMQGPIHLSFGQVEPIVDGKKYWWTGKKLRSKKSFPKSEIVSYNNNNNCKTYIAPIVQLRGATNKISTIVFL